MSVLPIHYLRMLRDALSIRGDEVLSAKLFQFALPIYSAAWGLFISKRLENPDDNEPRHELVVLASGCRIRGGMDVTKQRTGIIVDLLHDASPLNRAGITEGDIIGLPENERPARYAERTRRRKAHMAKGAEIAKNLLRELREQYGADYATDYECHEACRIIGNHDLIKVDDTPYPEADDELAVACYEADQLFLIHPLGIVGDMDRGPTTSRNSTCAEHWAKQLTHNVGQFKKWRAILATSKCPGKFLGDTLFRTEQGYAIYQEWLAFWNLPPT